MKAAGITTVIELPPIERWTKTGGKSLTRRWTGPAVLIGPDTVSGTKAQQLRAAGVGYEIEKEPGRFPIISATYGADETQPATEPLSDTWVMDVNEIERDIWEHPFIVAEIAKTFAPHVVAGVSLTAQQSAYAGAQAIKDIKAMLRGETVEQDGRVITLDEAIAAAVAVGMSSAALWAWIQDLLKGLASFAVDQHVLRRVRVVPDSTAIKAVELNSNIGRIFSTSSLRALEKAPATLPVVGDLPSGFWLKKRPRSEPVAPGKWKIWQEYWHADSYAKTVFGNPL
jgi:hypothetical protein